MQSIQVGHADEIAVEDILASSSSNDFVNEFLSPALFEDSCKKKKSSSSSKEPNSPNISRRSILRRETATKIVSAEELKSLPHAVKKVGVLNLDEVENMMNKDALARFQLLKRLTFQPLFQRQPLYTRQQHQDHKAHAYDSSAFRSYVECGVIEEVHDLRNSPSFSVCAPFFVRETKQDPDTREIFDRARFILWPKQQNDWISEAGYVPEVPLRHIAMYLDSVALDSSAAVADLSSGFYQIEIPKSSRGFFRFVTADNRIFQMKRLPMGLSTSPEIMQMITEVVVGHPRVCSPEYCIVSCGLQRHRQRTGGSSSSPLAPSFFYESSATEPLFDEVFSYVWIDDFKISSNNDEQMEYAISVIERRREDLNVTFKERLSISEAYTFLGVDFDHQSQRVAVTEKTRQKLPASRPQQQQTVADLEKLVARLIWCSGVTMRPLAPFYFVIKWAARKINQLNRGMLAPNDVVEIPASVLPRLHDWYASAFESRFISVHADEFPKKITIFCDASLKGWGAVCFDIRNRVWMAGNSWSDSASFEALTSSDICRLEARAFANAIAAFGWIIKDNPNVAFKIDNTSVGVAVRKGHARSIAVNNELQFSISQLNDKQVKFTVDYVASANNIIADKLSRQQQVSTGDVAAQMLYL